MDLKYNRKNCLKSRIIKKLMRTLFLLVAVFILQPSTQYASEKETIILYTNDVHCAIEDYACLAAYKAQLEETGKDVLVVDAGDAIQGEVIGFQTQGKAVIDLMNEVGYRYAIPGNHEFDYGMDTFLELASQESSKFEYLSSTFIDLRTNETVFKPYDIIEINGMKLAFVGISTPESYTKSSPVFFQDENGNTIYSFSQNDFYVTIQKAVDAARAEGVDKVIALGHLGVSGSTEGWKSTDVIANTSGIDVFIDAHSHEVINEKVLENKQGDKVLLSSTGTKFEYFGQLSLTSNKEEITLISPQAVDVNSSEAVKIAYNKVKEKVDAYNAEIEYLYEKIGTSEVELTLYDPDSGDWVIRTKETNLGDFVSDAYRIMTGADISLANGGGIRASVMKGDVTRKAFMDVNPWNNPMCVISATGQEILDALEFGTRNLPDTAGGFLHTSGLTYEVHAYIESPVNLDEKGSFKAIDESAKRRVTNVKVNGEPINPAKKYTVASTYYLLKQGGDGFTMFDNSEIVKKDGLLTDSEMLIHYLTDKLNGVVSKEQYGNPKGEGRFAIYLKEEDVPVKPAEGTEEVKKEIPESTKNENVKAEETTEAKVPQTADENNPAIWLLLAMTCATVSSCCYKRMKTRKRKERK